MAKKINKKLVGTLTILTMAVLLGAGYAVIRVLQQRDPRPHAAQAERFYAAGNYQAAIQAYTRAFQFDPEKDTTYLVKAANIAWADLGAIQMAQDLCNRALTIGADPQAQELLLEIYYEQAKTFGGLALWKSVAEEAQRILPTEPLQLADFERTYPQIAARAYHAMADSELARRFDDPRLLASAEQHLRRITFSDPRTGQPPLDPGNVDAAITLRNVWLTKAFEAFKRDGDVETARRLVADAASLMQSVVDATATKGDKMATAQASLFQLLPANPFADEPRIKLPAPFLAVTDPAKRAEVEAVLNRIADMIHEAEKSKLTKTRLTHKLLIALRRNLADNWSYINEREKQEALLRESVELYGSLPTPYLDLGRLLRIQGRYDEEKTLYVRAIETVKPQTGIGQTEVSGARAIIFDQLVTLSLADRTKAANAEAAKALLDKARQYSEDARKELGPEEPIVRLMHARVLRAEERTTEAVRELEEGLGRPVAPIVEYEIRSLLAEMYYRQQLTGKAKEMATGMRAIRPNVPAPYLLLAKIALEQEDLREALNNLNFLLEPQGERPPLAPGLSEALVLRAAAHAKLGMHEAANRDLEASRQGSVDDPVDVIRQAALDAESQRYVEAEAALLKLLAADATNLDAIRLLFSVYRLQGQMQRIKPVVLAAMAKAPDDPMLKRFSLLLDENLTTEQRNEAMLETIKSNPDPLRRGLELSQFYQQIGKVEQARDALREAEKVDPKSSAVIEQAFILAVAMAQGSKSNAPDRWADAEHYAQRAVELNLDQAHGRVFEGRLALAKADSMSNKDEMEKAAAYSQAITLLRDGLDQYPSNVMNWVYLGQAYLGLGNIDEARKALLRAISMQPNNGIAHWNMAMISEKLGDMEAVKRHLREAVKDRRLATNPDLVNAERLLREEEDPKAAIVQREEERRQNPDDLSNLIRLATLYEREGRYDDVESVLKDAVARKPDDRTAHYALARYYQLRGRFEEAEPYLDALLARASDAKLKAQIALDLARIFEQSGRPDDLKRATEYIQAAHQAQRSSGTAAAMASFLARRQAFRESLKWYDEALELAGDDLNVRQPLLRDKIRVALELKDRDLAAPMLQRYRADYPDDTDGLILDAQLAIIRGDLDKAIDIYNQRLSRNPGDALAHWHRGVVYAIAGNYQRAIEDLSKARDNAPGGARNTAYQHRVQLARCLVGANRIDEAIAELRDALDVTLEQIPNTDAPHVIAGALIEVLTAASPSRDSDAEALMLRMADKYPDNPAWRITIGNHAAHRKDYQTALRWYQDAVNIARRMKSGVSWASALRAMVRCYGEMNEHSRIGELLGGPDNAEFVRTVPVLQIDLAASTWRGGDQEGGWQQAIEGLTLARNNPLMFRTILTSLTEPVGAEALLRRTEAALSSKPGDMLLLKLRLALLLELNRNEAEFAPLIATLTGSDVSPVDKAFSLLLIGNDHYMKKRYQPAADYYKRLLEFAPDNALALNNLAYVLANDLNRPAEALPYAEKAATQADDQASCLDTLGWAQALNGQYEAARGSFFRALELQIDFLPARMHLGMTYLREGVDRAAARRHLELARTLAVRQQENEFLALIEDALKQL